MRLSLALVPLLIGCEPVIGIDDAGYPVGEGGSWTDLVDTNLEDEVDWSMYDGATLQIERPTSGSFLPYEDRHDFKAVLLDADGNELDYSDIEWTTSEDTEWKHKARSFQDALDVGLHDITATVELPNGDRLTYTVGGILVQSRYAGTYAGLFSATINVSGFPTTCSGSSIVIVGAYGEEAFGEGNCLASLAGRDLPLTFLYDLDNDHGHLTGTADADIFGWFTYPFAAEGGILADGPEMDLAWNGSISFGNVNAKIGAELGAPRVSRDTE